MSAAADLPIILLLLCAAGLIAAAPSPSLSPDCSSLQSLLSPCVSFVGAKQEQSPTDECCSGLENVVSINATCACDLQSMSLVSPADRFNVTLRMLDLPKLCSVVEFDPGTACNIQISAPPPPSFNAAPGDSSSSSSSSVSVSAFAAGDRRNRILFLFLTTALVRLSC